MEQHLLSPREPGLDGYLKHLFDWYYNPMLAYAYSELRDEMEAEDRVSDAFLSVKLANPLFASITNARNYLFIVVRNHCIKAKAEKRLRDNYFNDLSSQLPTFTEIETSLHACLDVSEWLEQLLSSLSNSSKMIIKKSFLEGKSVKEIAEEMGRTENSVASQKSKAMKELRDDNNDLPKDLILFLLAIMQLHDQNFL